MKIIPGFKVCGLILAAAFFAGVGFGTSASAQSHAYLIDLNSKTATDLGTLGGEFSSASGINDAGQVVGYSDTAGGATHAFITGPEGVGMRDLGSLDGGNSYARGINDAGRIGSYKPKGLVSPSQQRSTCDLIVCEIPYDGTTR